TREISVMVAGVRAEVETAVELVKESQDQASSGVALGDRAAAALSEIRSITGRTFSAVEATVAETARLESQGQNVVEASRRVARRVDEVTHAAVEQASHGRELARQTQEMARTAASSLEKAHGSATTARELAESVHRLTAAIDEIRAAHQVLTKGDAAISEEVAQVREDARKVIRIGDGLARSVDQLAREANGLDTEVFHFKLPTPKRGGTLRMGLHSGAMFEGTRGLDPAFTVDAQMMEASSNMYSTLLRSDVGVLLPGLAERWEADPSARRYRFYLRRGVQFHDGVLFSAVHAKQHFERLLNPANKASDQWIFKEVEGAAEFLSGKARNVAGIEVLDDNTLEVRLTEPKAFFLHLFTLPSTAVARLDGASRPVGTGPFQPTRIDRELIVLERNPRYFIPEQPSVDRLEIRLYTDRDAVIGALQAGEVDVASALFPESVSKLEALHSIPGSVPSSSFLCFNLRDAPYNDPRVRQGIRAGLDVQRMVERFHPGAMLAKTLTPPGLLEDRDAPPVPRPDVGLASQLLREAGVNRVRMTLYYPPGRSTEAEDAVLFAPLVEAGLLELSHVQVPGTEFWQKAGEGRLPSFRGVWIADYPDPDNFLYFLLNSNAQTVYSLGYLNAELDRVTAEARVSIDPELRNQLYRKAERLLHRDASIIPLYHDRFYAAAHPRVQGLRLYQTPPQVRAETLWVDEG
ncbi:MAG TPA: ABC transporter substrate-binding protein, partial [Myxococcaceae bacterium]|nr:ABC transporter substrate-binding protein [Myxococcaceae bacterium]